MKSRSVLSVAAAALLALGGCASKSVELAPPAAPALKSVAEKKELRGVWVTNVDSDVLTSKRKIAEGMEALSKAGINVVYPVVWNKAQTLYPSPAAASVTGTIIDPLYGDRDPLEELRVEAHARGIEVIPWFEFGFATSYNLGGGVILKNRPHWAALDQEGKLAKKNNFEWMNAFDPEVQEFMASLVLEVAERYDVDGIQGDDRMPALPSLAGYDEATKARYKKETGKDAPADVKEEHWVRWRANILTEWLASLRGRVKAIDENLIISMSPSYYDWALYEYLQDSYTWTNKGLVDSIHPQAYRYDLEAYKKIVDNLVAKQFTPEQLALLSPGLLIKSGTYRIPNDYFLDAIAYNREKGVNGEVHFFYTGLREKNDELLGLLASGPYREPASLPYRTQSWRPGVITFELLGTAGDVTTYGIAAPVEATYDVYVRVPEGSTTKAVTFALTGEEGTRTVTPGVEADWGWLPVGRAELGQGEAATVTATGATGEVMMLLNRKLSPKTIVP
jgi:uncharacterized lipoprotein YddW (UPF0748 family)